MTLSLLRKMIFRHTVFKNYPYFEVREQKVWKDHFSNSIFASQQFFKMIWLFYNPRLQFRFVYALHLVFCTPWLCFFLPTTTTTFNWGLEHLHNNRDPSIPISIWVFIFFCSYFIEGWHCYKMDELASRSQGPIFSVKVN